MSEIVPRSAEAAAYAAECRELVEGALLEALTEPGTRTPGSLRSVAVHEQPDGTHVVATFTLEAHGDTAFVVNRLIIPEYGADKSAWLAAAVFTTSVWERYDTRAKRQQPIDGIVRY